MFDKVEEVDDDKILFVVVEDDFKIFLVVIKDEKLLFVVEEF